MSKSPVLLNDIVQFLDNELAVSSYPETERGGVYYPSSRPIRKVGLVLEPFPTLVDWINENHLDAIWVHRPWQLDPTTLPTDVGIMTHHLPFDETLTMGYNLRLAKQLEATNTPEILGYKPDKTNPKKVLKDRPIGMLVDVSPNEFDGWLETVKAHFDGYDRAEAGCGASAWQADSTRIAVVGAMTDALVREAAGRGACLYLTGAYRKAGQAAVDETGIAVIAVGHRRTEEWGLRALASLIEENWPVACIMK